MFLHVLAVAFALSGSTIWAQAYDAVVDPIAGDSIYSLVDNLPTRIEIGQPGPSQVWDFTSLQSPFVRKHSFKEGKANQTALSIEKSGVDFQYTKIDESVFLSAIINADPLRIGRPVSLYCSPVLLEYKNPIEYNDASSNYSRLIGYLPWSDMPSRFQIGGFDISDSLRLVLEINRDDAVDAWGDLLMQNESFEVVRMRRIEEQILHVYGRDNNGDWLDISSSFQELLNGVSWNSITYSYLYLSSGLPGPVAEVYTDQNDIVEKVIFSADPKMAEEIAPDKRLRGVYVYPNPTLGYVRFELFNIPNGNYELNVYNILGKKMWSPDEKVTPNKVILADLSFLRRGTYFYSLLDDTGKRIVTRRLIIIKP